MEFIDGRFLSLSKEDFNITSKILLFLKGTLNYNDSPWYIDNYNISQVYQEYTLNDVFDFLQSNLKNIESKEFKKKIKNKKYLQIYLNILVAIGRVVTTDVLGGENTYKAIPDYKIDSGYTRNYSNISIATAEKILLVSDTHIGNEEYEDFSLIKNVFQYAEEYQGINCAIHLGDVFQKDSRGYDYNSIAKNQIEKFREKFPENMKVIAIAGNHDISIIEDLKKVTYLGHPLAQNYLSIIKPNFHMILEREYGIVISSQNINISLKHPVMFNMFFPYVKTYEVDRSDPLLNMFKEYNTNNIDLYLSGHFHYPLSFSIPDKSEDTKRVYEVIPSLSKLSYNACVAKILRFIHDDSNNISHYGITPLYYTEKKLTEGEETIHTTNYQILKTKKR